MNDDQHNPHDLRPSAPDADTSLGEALGHAIDGEVTEELLPPPVSHIAERAAAKARARATRRTVGSVAASVALIAAGVVGWNTVRDDTGSTSTLAVSSTPAAASVPTDQADRESTSSEAAELPISGEFEDIEPEELSTGPLLEWTEVDGPPVTASVFLDNTTDGRILVGSFDESGAWFASSDGTSWELVHTPPGITPGQVYADGPRWVVTGFRDGDFAAQTGVFYSDDQGASWTELEVSIEPADPDIAPWITERSHVSEVMVSGQRMVLVVSSFRDVDVIGMLLDKGVVPDGELFGWGFGSDSIEVEVGDPLSEHETLTFSYDELALTAEEIAALEGPSTDRTRLFLSDGGPLEHVGEFQGSGLSGHGSPDGFALTLYADGPTQLLTSTDGRAWQTSDDVGLNDLVVGSDGTRWTAGWEEGLVIRRSSGGPFESAAAFSELEPSGMLSVGPSGLAITASPRFRGDLIETEPTSGSVAKDGYELRFEDEGRLGLYDADTGEPIRVFSAEEASADEPPEGVRLLDPDEFGFVFEDPVTGEDIVSFTTEDLGPIFGSAQRGPSSLAESVGDDVVPTVPEPWVGWSADGSAWGWQRISEAFGIDAPQTWATVVVGDDFVLASVEVYEFEGEIDVPLETESFEGEEFEPGDEPWAPTIRWFRAEIPG